MLGRSRKDSPVFQDEHFWRWIQWLHCFSSINRAINQWHEAHGDICHFLLSYTGSLGTIGSSEHTGAEMWTWSFALLSVTVTHRSSTGWTWSNRHSWLLFPSHWLKCRSLLSPWAPASMHLPERMWMIVPSWKEKEGDNSWQSQQRKTFLRFLLSTKRLTEVVCTSLEWVAGF